MKMNMRQIQKEQTRQHLLEVAFKEYANRGIMSTRMSDVAQAAGVSHGTVFVHFASQEALITAVIEEFGENITRRTHELASQCRSVEELLAAHLQSIMEFEAFYTRLVIEARLLPPVARDTFVMIQSAVSLHISQSAQWEIEAGTIRPMPMYLLFNTWLGLIHYYISNSDLFAAEDTVLKRYGPTLLEHYMNLLKTSR